MTSRERILSATSVTGIHETAYRRLRRALGLPERDVAIWHLMPQLAWVDDDVHAVLETDARDLRPKAPSTGNPNSEKTKTSSPTQTNGESPDANRKSAVITSTCARRRRRKPPLRKRLSALRFRTPFIPRGSREFVPLQNSRKAKPLFWEASPRACWKWESGCAGSRTSTATLRGIVPSPKPSATRFSSRKYAVGRELFRWLATLWTSSRREMTTAVKTERSSRRRCFGRCSSRVFGNSSRTSSA